MKLVRAFTLFFFIRACRVSFESQYLGLCEMVLREDYAASFRFAIGQFLYKALTKGK